VYKSCFACGAAFPEGTLVEHVPLGRRLAFDPGRGRLWVVCEACGGWTLAPIEERWEGLDELERAVTPRRGMRATLVAKTENVALFRIQGMSVVRVGATDLVEESQWRYGMPTAGTGGGVGASPFAPRPLRLGERLLAAGYVVREGFSGKASPLGRVSARRWIRYGDVAWRGHRSCAACGHSLRELTFFRARLLILRESGDEAFTPDLVLACPRCRDEREGGLHLEGVEAEFVLRRVLAHRQDGGIPPGHLRAAANLIELGGGPTALSDILARYGRHLGDLPITSAVALRVLATDAYEHRLLALEAAALERRWRREEELAAIVDGVLTDIPSLERMRRELRGL